MPGPVITGYDERDQSRTALALGSWLAPLLGVPLKAVYVGGGEPPEPPEGIGRVEVEAVEAGSASEGLLRAAAAEDASAIVVGSSDRGRIGRVFPGSTAVRVIHGTDLPVAIATRGSAEKNMGRARVIAVGYDTSPEAKAALQFAAKLGDPEHAALRVITVDPGVAPGEDTGVTSLRKQLKDELHETVRSLPEELRAEPRFRSGGNIAGILAEESSSASISWSSARAG